MKCSVMILVLAMTLAASDHKTLGEIDFYGHKGLDVATVRAVLPIHEGDAFPATQKDSDALKRQVREKVTQAIGRAPTDISFVCCDAKQQWMIYIGLPGTSYQAVEWNPRPAGEVRFPKAVMTLREQAEKALFAAVMKGAAGEDDSEGYALSTDPAARKSQLAMREYALRNEALILQVLATSSDSQHRATAAQLLGYARQNDAQLDALVHAALDPDDGVRNDAVRALGVLAGAKPEVAKRIPLEPFVRLLRSGGWTDHNKAGMVLASVTNGRDPRVLETLRAEALDNLLEMARWRSPGHAGFALMILGRIAGIEEDALMKLMAPDQAGTILAKFDAR